jgi:hypothetical protein
MDRINAESFRYGMGIGRLRMETKNVYINEARGVRKETQKLPVLVPVSVKNVYLDTPMPSMHSAQVLGEQIICRGLDVARQPRDRRQPRLDRSGGRGRRLDAAEPQGPRADDDGNVRLLEMEGDIVVPRKTTRSIVLPGTIVTVAIGGTGTDGKVSRAVSAAASGSTRSPRTSCSPTTTNRRPTPIRPAR